MRFVYYFPGRWVPLKPDLLSLDAHVGLTAAAARDPFIVLGSVAGVAPHMKLLTYLAVVPFRNPFLLAKQAATLDVLSGGRLLLGVGTGYQEPEFRALGVDFEARNALFDEGIEVMKMAWSGEPVFHRGSHFTAARAG